MGADPDKFSVGMFYDDVKPQYDADGNISGSNFDRYMHEAAHNRSFRNEEGYSREDQIILNRGEIFRVGNSYDAQEAAMRNNFTHSDNKYQRRRDIWT